MQFKDAKMQDANSSTVDANDDLSLSSCGRDFSDVDGSAGRVYSLCPLLVSFLLLSRQLRLCTEQDSSCFYTAQQPIP